jgi:hypothetical protein
VQAIVRPLASQLSLQNSDVHPHIADALDIARYAAAGDQRWLNALNTGADWLLQQEQITFCPERHELTVNSPSGKTYRANGACQCEAFAQHNACWYRAAARLVRRALELQEQALELAAFCEAWDAEAERLRAAAAPQPAPTIAERLTRARAAVDCLFA